MFRRRGDQETTNGEQAPGKLRLESTRWPAPHPSHSECHLAKSGHWRARHAPITYASLTVRFVERRAPRLRDNPRYRCEQRASTESTLNETDSISCCWSQLRRKKLSNRQTISMKILFQPFSRLSDKIFSEKTTSHQEWKEAVSSRTRVVG